MMFNENIERNNENQNSKHTIEGRQNTQLTR